MEPGVTAVGQYVALWVIPWSVLAACLMAWDKHRARARRRRIRERTLLFVALVGGAPGAWLAMVLFRHKTRHARFRFGLPVLTLAWLAVVAWSW